MKLKLIVTSVALASAMNAFAAQDYANFPVTVKGYDGSAKDSVAYTGQAARQVLHTSLKTLSKQGNGEPNAQLKAKMLSYFDGKHSGRDILSPVSKSGFEVTPGEVDKLSSDKNLAGKTYKGKVAGWPGNMKGPEMVRFMIDKASASNKGFDPLTGYDYTQLISKFLMGAVFYNQAVDNYLDEKLDADTSPNNKPYKKGAKYTGKEHVWDEAFGYFGAPVNTLSLTAEDVYNIAKQKPEAFNKADANNDGKVSLYNEMAYAHAYYAAGFDKGGKTNYLHTITQAFVDGRQLITDADGEALSNMERLQLKGYAEIIEKNWEKVIAEAVFKYAGSTYKDLGKLHQLIEANNDSIDKEYRAYAKHWGELKGFALALQTGKNNLGETADKLNKLIGFGPVLLGGTQVIGIDGNNDFIQSYSMNFEQYQLNMLKVQQLMVDEFGVKARNKDVLSDMSGLADKLSSGVAVEND